MNPIELGANVVRPKMRKIFLEGPVNDVRAASTSPPPVLSQYEIMNAAECGAVARQQKSAYSRSAITNWCILVCCHSIAREQGHCSQQYGAECRRNT